VLGLALSAVAPAGAGTTDMASALVKDTTDRMLSALEERRSELDSTPGLVYELVREIVVPNFDFERITQYAVGRYWRDATPAQKERLVAEFQRLLVRTYANALLNYSGQDIKILPLRPGSREGHVVVHTEVRESGGPTIPIDYQMYLKDGAWKVYDVTIDGVSLVANYRSTFATEIRRKGIDGLIETLETRNAQGTA
jgi:phospholipid transport system substrate-binding protein